ncbi:hypothetical protein OHA98_22600 [Streptomyces sp. NBC_00654]|uniref:hypothetical protein n=1 Tax=Streptomyces sp. NBC_00654 TaxID=2975799 RepID=UPI00224E9860|nr:hypothetical protein [Streptomyces sp. NBC_00654]MCX4967497.1 hypothetical protein [Streptomyces sp. NBC_00654]
MKRVPEQGATTAALRGVLALLLLAVGLLCLFARATQHHAPPSDQVSLSRMTEAAAVPAAEGTAPCGKKTAVNESAARRADAAPQLVPALGLLEPGVRHVRPAPRRDLPFPNGPAPPPPVALSSVLRM